MEAGVGVGVGALARLARLGVPGGWMLRGGKAPALAVETATVVEETASAGAEEVSGCGGKETPRGGGEPILSSTEQPPPLCPNRRQHTPG